MTKIEDFDLVVLGTGEAGKSIAWHMGGLGKRVAAIERQYLGGSCPNVACLPSKNFIHSAKVASYFRRGREFGLWSEGGKEAVKVDMSGVRERKRQMVEGLRLVHAANFTRSGAEVVWGSGRFVGERTLEVALRDGGTRVLRGETIVIDTGSRASLPAVPGLAEAAPLTHVEALDLDRLPEHLLVLGGGYVGLELAQAFRRFGARVTVVERNARLLPREDEDVSEAIKKLFTDEGIETITDVNVTRVTGRSGKRVELEIAGAVRLEGSHLLVAAGRTPNTDAIGLEAAGVATTESGYIRVNERLETTAPGVWGVGDCAGSPLFTHIGYDDFRVVRDNLAGVPRVTTGRQVPSCLFTDPELARVGLDETEAKRRGVEYRVAEIPMAAVLRTRTLSEMRGFAKALISAEDDRILGFTCFGTGAGEMMAPVQVAMSAGLPYTVLREMILTHPTLAEGLGVLFSKVPASKPGSVALGG